MPFLLWSAVVFTSCAGAKVLVVVPHNASYSADKQINTIRTLHNKNSAEFGVSPVWTVSQNKAGLEVLKIIMLNSAEHEILIAHKKNIKKFSFFRLR